MSKLSEAVHIAIASTHEIDYLPTLVSEHIANPKIQPKLKTITHGMGFSLPLIYGPEQPPENDEGK